MYCRWTRARRNVSAAWHYLASFTGDAACRTDTYDLPQDLLDEIRRKRTAATNYRERSLQRHGLICARCAREFSLKDRHLLTVHHKDGNHDNNHLPRLVDFVNAANFAMQEAERLGVAERIRFHGRIPREQVEDYLLFRAAEIIGADLGLAPVVADGVADEQHGWFEVYEIEEKPATLE